MPAEEDSCSESLALLQFADGSASSDTARHDRNHATLPRSVSPAPVPAHSHTSSQPSVPTKANVRIGLMFIRNLRLLFKIMFPQLRSVAVLFFVLLLLIAALEQVLVYYVGSIPSEFYAVLNNKDSGALKPLIWKSLGLVVGVAIVVAARTFAAGRLYVEWRRLLVQRFHLLYFEKLAFYRVNVLDDEAMDNPDQRMTQDIERFSQTLSTIADKVVLVPFTIGYYSYRCGVDMGWYGPVSVYIFFIVSSVINRFLMNPIASRVYEQERREGDFRFQHVVVRRDAEAIAFLHGQKYQHAALNNSFDNLLAIQKTIVNRELFLNISVQLFDYIGSILSYLVLAIPVFSGAFDNLDPGQLSSKISQSAFVAIYLIFQFSVLTNLATNFSELAGYAHRLGEMSAILQIGRNTLAGMVDLSDDCADTNSEMDISASSISPPSDVLLELVNVTYQHPRGRTNLLVGLSLKLERNVNVLLRGHSGCGKTTLFRVICGLWPASSGEIIRHLPFGHNGIFCLPQRPFVCSGTLVEHLTYPALNTTASAYPDSYYMELLRSVDLLHLIARAGGLYNLPAFDWTAVLSPGEKQRLAFARLFHHRPRLAVLDEATSAIEESLEARLYLRCRELGITYLSSGYRDSLNQYHQVELSLKGDSTWALRSL